MDGKMLARLGAIVFVAMAITAMAIDMTRKEYALPTPSAARTVELEHDPLRAGQRRCQLLGQKAASDLACLRTWAKTRDRFLGRTPAPSAAKTAETR